jgi:hypothetical protein
MVTKLGNPWNRGKKKGIIQRNGIDSDDRVREEPSDDDVSASWIACITGDPSLGGPGDDDFPVSGITLLTLAYRDRDPK